MKLVEVNGWLGHTMYQLLDFIRVEQPDILCVQEVLEAGKPNPLFTTFSLLTNIKEAGGFAHHFFSPTYYFEAFDDKVEMGNAIFSKFPITQDSTVFVHGKYHKQTADNYERNIRNLQVCRLQLAKNRFVTLANHHGFHDLNPLGTDATIAAMQKVAKALEPMPRPLIFCADMNVKPLSPALAKLAPLGLRNLVLEAKVQTTLSSLHRANIRDEVVCDYIFASEDVSIKNFSVSETLVSDHKALILEFDI